MKIQHSLFVHFYDTKTFAPVAAAEQFRLNFNKHYVGNTSFRFYDERELNKAKAFLETENVEYHHGIGIELESDDELNKYPCVFIAFWTEYKTLINSSNKDFVDIKRMKKRNIQRDTASQQLIFTKKASNFFKKEVPAISFKSIFDLSQKTEFYKMADLAVCNFPLQYKNAFGIKESSNPDTLGKYSVTKFDGRISMEKKALTEIKENKLMGIDKFLYKNEVYVLAMPSLIASGEFAFELKQEFDFTKENIQIEPLTLDYI